jgi:hypothetical protein
MRSCVNTAIKGIRLAYFSPASSHSSSCRSGQRRRRARRAPHSRSWCTPGVKRSSQPGVREGGKALRILAMRACKRHQCRRRSGRCPGHLTGDPPEPLTSISLVHTAAGCSKTTSGSCQMPPAVGRGHASLLTDSDTRHSKPFREIGYLLICYQHSFRDVYK